MTPPHPDEFSNEMLEFLFKDPKLSEHLKRVRVVNFPTIFFQSRRLSRKGNTCNDNDQWFTRSFTGCLCYRNAYLYLSILTPYGYTFIAIIMTIVSAIIGLVVVYGLKCKKIKRHE